MKKFTRTEWEIILHRLEVGDAIVEVLQDGDKNVYAAGEILDKIDMLKFNGFSRVCFDELDLIILRECCEGSTWFAGLNNELQDDVTTPARVAAYTRAANRLEDKLNVSILRA